jgi:hypothetical protein
MVNFFILLLTIFMHKRRSEIWNNMLHMPDVRFLPVYCFFIPVIFVLASCEKFKGDQQVPAYLSIDSIYIYTDYATQGSTSQNITDAWVYVDGQFIGAFELPAKFPVLEMGIHKVEVMAGIKKNGISATRWAYEYYAPIIYNVKFGIDSLTKMHTLKTTYSTSANFLWKEDFEGTSMSLDSTNRSLVPVLRTPEGSNLTIEGLHSAMMVIDSLHDFAEAQSHDVFPISFAPTYVELNFNTNNVLTVGVILYGPSAFYQIPILNLNVTNNQQKKIYVDLAPALTGYPGVDQFRVYFGTFKDTGVKQGVIILDNIKVITSK